ncbi:hypothetical protein MRX96_031628 [Rhipicephalus microplus]
MRRVMDADVQCRIRRSTNAQTLTCPRGISEMTIAQTRVGKRPQVQTAVHESRPSRRRANTGQRKLAAVITLQGALLERIILRAWVASGPAGLSTAKPSFTNSFFVCLLLSGASSQATPALSTVYDPAWAFCCPKLLAA